MHSIFILTHNVKENQHNHVVWSTQFFIYTNNTAILLQRDETRRVCGSNTRATVLHWLVGDGELSQVVTTHLRLQRGDKQHVKYGAIEFYVTEIRTNLLTFKQNSFSSTA